MMIENFELTEYIASCGQNLTTSLDCEIHDAVWQSIFDALASDGVNVFVGTSGPCNADAESIDYGDGMKLCYHTSQTSTVNVFNS